MAAGRKNSGEESRESTPIGLHRRSLYVSNYSLSVSTPFATPLRKINTQTPATIRGSDRNDLGFAAGVIAAWVSPSSFGAAAAVTERLDDDALGFSEFFEGGAAAAAGCPDLPARTAALTASLLTANSSLLRTQGCIHAKHDQREEGYIHDYQQYDGQGEVVDM